MSELKDVITRSMSTKKKTDVNVKNICINEEYLMKQKTMEMMNGAKIRRNVAQENDVEEREEDENFEVNPKVNDEDEVDKIKSMQPLTFDDSLIILRQICRSINKIKNIRPVNMILSHAVKSSIQSHKRKNKKNRKPFEIKIKY